LPSFIIITRPT